jgi:hypothetical protein
MADKRPGFVAKRSLPTRIVTPRVFPVYPESGAYLVPAKVVGVSDLGPEEIANGVRFIDAKEEAPISEN